MAKKQNGKAGSLRPSQPMAAAASTATAAAPNACASPVRTTLTHQQIAERAYYIWLRKGRPRGQDLENWREAEADLLAQARQ